MATFSLNELALHSPQVAALLQVRHAASEEPTENEARSDGRFCCDQNPCSEQLFFHILCFSVQIAAPKTKNEFLPIAAVFGLYITHRRQDGYVAEGRRAEGQPLFFLSNQRFFGLICMEEQ